MSMVGLAMQLQQLYSISYQLHICPGWTATSLTGWLPVKLMVPSAYTWSCTLLGWLPPSPPSVRAHLGAGPSNRIPKRLLKPDHAISVRARIVRRRRNRGSLGMHVLNPCRAVHFRNK
jgi:hypothetical protein